MGFFAMKFANIMYIAYFCMVFDSTISYHQQTDNNN